jgi:hypothetical protein
LFGVEVEAVKHEAAAKEHLHILLKLRPQRRTAVA